MRPQELEGVRARLEEFAAEVFGSFARADQRGWAGLYVRGLLGEGRRKSMEPMAARLGVDRQGLQQVLTDSPWSSQLVLAEVAGRMNALIGPRAWVIDDVSIPKDGYRSPGVARQYCGALGKRANCQVLPSVHLVTDTASCPVNWRLFLPASWDPAEVGGDQVEEVVERRRKARIPDGVGHVPKWRLALDMLDELAGWGLRAPLVVADEGYGQDGPFRTGLTMRGVRYVVGVPSNTSLLPATARRTTAARTPGKPGPAPRPRYTQASRSAKNLVLAAGRRALRTVTWRTGSKGEMRSRFLALRVRQAGRSAPRDQALPVCWLLAEWPTGEKEPAKYWLSTLPADTPLPELIALAKIRWRVEHDYRELKTALGLAHFEGRTWTGLHHHLALITVAHAFITRERLRPPPPATT